MTDSPVIVGGRYELLEPLGRGGMADVHRARDRVLHREVAIKLLRDVSDVDRDRFAGEARLLALLTHESVVTVYDAGVEAEQPWLALELVEGRSLAQLLADGPVEARTLAGLAAQVAAGLGHAHAHSVVHRDVKPANVLVSSDGRARLADFGIARLVDSSAQLTLTGHAIGTAAYLAPEQVRGERVTGAADVYALGLVLLEALTGRRSFDGTAVEAAMARLHHGPLIPTSLPAGWPGLLAAMTATDPAERPPADAVAVRLRELAGTVPVAVADAGETGAFPVVAAVSPGSPASTVSTQRYPARVLAVAAAAVVALLLTTTVLVSGGKDGAPAAAGTPSGSTKPAASTSSTAAEPRQTADASATPVAAETEPPAVEVKQTKPPKKSGPARDRTKAKHQAPGKSKGKSKGKAKGKAKGKSKGKGKGR